MTPWEWSPTVTGRQLARPGTYLIRLQVRIGTRLNTDETCLTATVWSREVSIESRTGALSEAEWLILQARGFPSEAEASEFGERLRLLTLISGLCAHVGLDTGRDEMLGQFTEAFLRDIGFEPDKRAPPEVHGIAVLPDDGKSIFIYGNATASTRSDPTQLLGAVEEISDSTEWDVGEYSADTVLALRLLNLAMISNDSRARIVLAISAIEGLIRDERWTDKQRRWIRNTVSALKQEADGELDEIATRVQGIRRTSIRGGVFSLLDENGRPDLRERWDEIYENRSKLFHGGTQVDRHELHRIAYDTLKLCVTIVLTVLRNKGIELPAVAEVHFPDLRTR